MAYIGRQLKEMANGLELVYEGPTTLNKMFSKIRENESKSFISFWKTGILFDEMKTYADFVESRKAEKIILENFDKCFADDYAITVEIYQKKKEDGRLQKEYFNISSKESRGQGIVILKKKL